MVAQPEPPFGPETLKVSSTHGQPGIVVYIRRRHLVEAQRVGIEVQPGGDDIGRVLSSQYPKHGPIRATFLVSAQIFVSQLYASTNELAGAVHVRIWPRLCKNAALIIMYRSRILGQLHEAFHRR